VTVGSAHSRPGGLHDFKSEFLFERFYLQILKFTLAQFRLSHEDNHNGKIATSGNYIMLLWKMVSSKTSLF
jgi:hypothetical protein